MQPQVDLSPVTRAIDKLDGAIADVRKKQTDWAVMQGTIARIENDLQKCQASFANGIATVHSKQDAVAAAVQDFPNSKFRIDVNPLVDLKPLMNATERIDRHTTDTARSLMDEVAKIAAAQLEHKYAIEHNLSSTQFHYALSKLEEKVDKFQPTSVTVTGPGARQEYVVKSSLEKESTVPSNSGSYQLILGA